MIATPAEAAPEPATVAPRGRWPLGPAWLVLAGMLAAAGGLLLAFQSQMTFIFDDWGFLLYRREWSPDALLDAHNQHIVVAPAAIYKLLLDVFGMDSARPFQVVSDLFLLLNGALLFVYARRRVGDWMALMAVALILFYGAAWQHLLWSFQLALSGSIATGLGALIALDRDDRAGDRLACALLVGSVLFSEIGVAFALGAAVSVALGPRSWRPRAYLAALPLVLYAVWWLWWARGGEPSYVTATDSSFSFENVATSPGYVLDAIAQAIAAMLGLANVPSSASAAALDPTALAGLDWGRILLAAGVFAAVLGLRNRPGALSKGLLVVVAIGVSFWFLAAFNQNPLRPPTNPRLLYPGGVLVLLIAIELLRGVNVGRWGLLAAGAVTLAAVASNLTALEDGKRWFEGASGAERADLTVAELTADSGTDFRLDTTVGGVWLQPIEASAYVDAVDAHGSPAYTEAELASASGFARAGADQALAVALDLRLVPGADQAGASPGKERCPAARATATGETGIELGPSRVTFNEPAGSEAKVVLGRYGDDFTVNELGSLRPGGEATLEIPADASSRPWRLGLVGSGLVTVCVAPV